MESERLNPLTLDTFRLLQHGEAELRLRSFDAIEKDERMRLHLEIVRCATDVIDVFRQWNTEDQDVKVIQVLGIRQFNA